MTDKNTPAFPFPAYTYQVGREVEAAHNIKEEAMSKEAMKLATEFNRYFTSMNGVDVPERVSVPRDEWRALFEALAEQPAQQEPVIGETNVELGFYSNDASNGQQRELVGKVEMGQLVGNRPHESASNPDAKREIAVIAGVDEYGPMLNWYTHWVNFPVGTKLYTSPPARKPLTDGLPCCGYTDATAIKWNEFNHAVQCHNCGHTYTKTSNEPLTLEYIDQHIGADEGDREAVVALVREVEAAHNIKEKNT